MSTLSPTSAKTPAATATRTTGPGRGRRHRTGVSSVRRPGVVCGRCHRASVALQARGLGHPEPNRARAGSAEVAVIARAIRVVEHERYSRRHTTSLRTTQGRDRRPWTCCRRRRTDWRLAALPCGSACARDGRSTGRPDRGCGRREPRVRRPFGHARLLDEREVGQGWRRGRPCLYGLSKRGRKDVAAGAVLPVHALGMDAEAWAL